MTYSSTRSGGSLRRCLFAVLIGGLIAGTATGQDSLLLPEPAVVRLDDLVMEALARSPRILAAAERIPAANARARQAGVPDPPELIFRRKEMDGFRWSEAMATEWELMQMLKFPTKYSTESRIEEIRAGHAHHESEEIVNTVLRELREAYAGLWFVQQRLVIEEENRRITGRLRDITASRYTVGTSSRSEMLMASMLRTMSENALVELRRSELGIKAELSSLLGRASSDTMGYAVVDEEPALAMPLDTLLARSVRTRPMLIHDSLSIVEQEEMASSARQAVLPDFRLGISYMDSDHEPFGGWTVTAGLTLPFAPWSLGKASAGVEEAESRIAEARETYASTRAMVTAEVRSAWLEASGKLEQLRSIGNSLLPAAQEALESALAGYESGAVDYLPVHEAYATAIRTQIDYFTMRLDFEKAVARIRFATGYNGELQ